jgi:hypothetical protein
MYLYFQGFPFVINIKKTISTIIIDRELIEVHHIHSD